MRTIEEIKADIRDCEACAKLKCFCGGDCNICDCIYSSNLPGFENELRLALVADIPLNRLEETCNAEREGRCAVLPCKVGDTVYGLGSVFGKRLTCKLPPIMTLTIVGFMIRDADMRCFISCGEYEDCDYGGCELQSNFTISDIGKTVFLTHKAAEQALKEREAE